MKKIITVVLLVVLALAIATGIYIWSTRYPYPQPQIAITPAPGGYTLINGNITVNYEYFIQFTIPSGAFDINVSGNFCYR